jgi:hypothetical protein
MGVSVDLLYSELYITTKHFLLQNLNRLNERTYLGLQFKPAVKALRQELIKISSSVVVGGRLVICHNEFYHCWKVL